MGNVRDVCANRDAGRDIPDRKMGGESLEEVDIADVPKGSVLWGCCVHICNLRCK